ncbi:TolC family outer membrane protein [Mesorhizobium sp. KR9-304]|uniref:TolC family outer membrane protein n=1 Tax=Mesorhizobium sp. KR9-304 TaxID=3156614 RepID=UPI0032B4BDA7
MVGLRVGGIAIAIVMAATTFHARATTLREAVQQAVLTNPRIDAAQANRRATEYSFKQAKGRFLPEVEINADIGQQKIDRPEGLGPDVNNTWQDRRQAGISIRQVLFDGWDRANDIYRTQASISAASFRVMVRSEAVGLNSVEAYIDVIRHRDLLALAQDNLRRHQALLRIIQERYDGGRAPIGDLQQTIERVEAAKALVAQIKVSSETARAKYKNAVGISPSDLKSVSYATGIPKSVADVTNRAIRNNPRVKEAVAETEVSYFDKEQFRSTLYPQVYLEGNAMAGENLEGTPGRDNELEAMVVLRWKLFDGGVRRNRTAELGERYSEKLSEQMILVRELTQEVEIAWARLVDGRAEVQAIQREVDQNIKVVASYQDEYNANKRSLLDVLDAENSKFASQFELSNVTALHVFSSYELLAQMGVLLDTLGVQAPEIPDVPADPLPAFLRSPAKSQFDIPALSQE